MHERVRALIAEELPGVIELRRDLHMHPELMYEEFRTADLVRRELARAGVEFVPGLAGGTGTLAAIPGNSARAIALRADMDALPIHEESECPWRSRIDGKMHACGHDGHTATLIGTVRVLARLSREAPLPRPVTFIFQPAEEGGAGGRRMVEEGALDGSRLGAPVDEAYALHGWPHFELGTAGTRIGPMLAASDRFEIRVEGEGGHAAWPHATRDPIPAACAIVAALQTIVSRNAHALDPSVLSVTTVQAGTAFNVIPSHATIQGTVRTLSAESRQLYERRIAEIASAIALAHGCSTESTYRHGYPITSNHPTAVDRFEHEARRIIGADRVRTVPHPVMVGEDFAFYGQEVPSCFFALGLRRPEWNSMPDLHQPDFDFTDDAMALGMELFASLALRAS
ncbi:MAG: amidohydrolase [Phycisphaeraceae bacterium]|nr:amidohydrolase [Phycisphaeraceae bacterium]